MYALPRHSEKRQRGGRHEEHLRSRQRLQEALPPNLGCRILSIDPERGAISPLLELSGIVKQFPGTLALDQVDLDVKAGEIHALLGQNGAGKSTLIKLLAGIYAPTGGVVRWRGEIVDPAAMHLPITFIHQDLGLVESMTVAENIALLTGYPRKHH